MKEADLFRHYAREATGRPRKQQAKKRKMRAHLAFWESGLLLGLHMLAAFSDMRAAIDLDFDADRVFKMRGVLG